jgi:hypothetical protein
MSRKYRITKSNGAQIKLREVSDVGLNKLAFAATVKLRKAIYHMLEMRREVKRRGLEHPQHMHDLPIDIVNKALMLAYNDINENYKNCKPIMEEEE